MAFVFKFPDVGEGIHEGRVVEWLVVEGVTVAEDQPLLKVETDKAVVELPSPRAGVVLKLHAAADADIRVGDALISIGEAGEVLPIEPETGVATTAAEQVATRSEPDEGPPTPVRRPLATPRTRALARRLGVDLAVVAGSGHGGRITDEDVERAAQQPARAERVADAVQAATPAGTGTESAARGQTAATARPPTADLVERVPISHLRKVIASAMSSSKHTSAHVTHVDEADVTDLVAAYRDLKPKIEQRWGVRFTLLSFFIKALVAVLKDHPIFNASVDEERQELLLKRFYNIGIAVDTPEGLIVPVLKDADGKDMVSIARELGDLAERARERRLGLDELRGGTCTLTNIGPLGGVFATPIINQPELAIVGLHKITERPAVVDGEIVVRHMMYLSVSFDHRYVDGANAARFMTDLVRLVADPSLLMARL